MRGYVAARVLLFLPAMLGVVTLVFFLGRALPGDPVDLMLGEGGAVERRADLRRALGLDDPLPVQYGRHLLDLSRGRLGESLRTRRPVAEELGRALPHTARLAGAALGLACLFAVPAALAAARGGRAGRWVGALTSAGLSTPTFFLGPVLLLAFAVWRPWFPVSGADEPGAWFLPAVTLAMPTGSLLCRLLAASLSEERGKEYLSAARARGLDEGAAFRRHALRNALLPGITVLGLQLGGLLTGAILTERVFRWPGLGTLVLGAISSRDYPVLQGAVLLFALLTLAATLATDLLYGLLDPRVRRDG
jgi:ABC-type dipeptide/oligopeptide/nickel transport system permease component